MALTKQQQALIEKYGGRQIQERTTFNMQVGSQGKRSTGKSHFAMTGRKPMLYINIDMGTDDVEDKMVRLRKQKDVMVLPIVVPPARKDDTLADMKIRAEEQYYTAKDAVTDACKGGFRTIVIDTTTEMWEIARLAYFGKTSGVPQLDYAVPNNLFSNFLRIPQMHDVDAVFIHQVSEIWVTEEYTNNAGEKKTRRVASGEFERDGFKKTDYIFRVDIEHLNRPLPGGIGLDFGIRITRSTTNPAITNMTVWQSELGDVPLSMELLAQMVYNVEEWK